MVGYRNHLGYRIGSWHGKAKLTEAQVASIRFEYRKSVRGFGMRALARRYNVSDSTVRDVVNYVTWPHVKQGYK